MMAQLWRTALAANPDVNVVANADDPMVVWAAIGSRAGHLVQRRPALARRLLGLPGVRLTRSSAPTASGGAPAAPLRRPHPQWTVEDDGVIDPTGAWHLVKLQLPGTGQPRQRGHRARRRRRVRRTPARGGPPAGHGQLGRRPVRPGRPGRPQHPAAAGQEPGQLAGGLRHGRRWRRRCCPSTPATPTVSTRPGCTTSTSPRCAAGQVLITGDRAFDLAVRLEVNDVPFRHVQTFDEALRRVPPGRLEVIANYTAFQDIRAELDRVN